MTVAKFVNVSAEEAKILKQAINTAQEVIGCFPPKPANFQELKKKTVGKRLLRILANTCLTNCTLASAADH